MIFLKIHITNIILRRQIQKFPIIEVDFFFNLKPQIMLNYKKKNITEYCNTK